MIFLRCDAKASWVGLRVEAIRALLSSLMVAKDLFVPTAAEAIEVTSELQKMIAQSAKDMPAW
jgi:hypothetical protein